MIVRAKSNVGKFIPINQRYWGEVDETSYSPVLMGEVYEVSGVLMINKRADFLVCPKKCNPLWVPQYLFDILDSEIQEEWHVRTLHNADEYKDLFYQFEITALIGYAFLVNDFKHYCGVVEGVETELLKFHLRKKVNVEL